MCDRTKTFWLACRASELRGSPDSKAFTRRGSGMASEADKAELDRERRALRQERADFERRLADLDRRQVCTHVTLLHGQSRKRT